MRTGTGNWKYFDNTHPKATISTTNSARLDLGLNLDCCGGKLVTNHLSYGVT
jgi:hypothetical protein